MAMNGHSKGYVKTSAYPPTTDIQNGDVCFAPDYFRFTPNSRPFLKVSQTSDVDPQRTLGGAEEGRTLAAYPY